MKQVVGYIDYVDNIRNSDGTFDIKAYKQPYCEHCHANHNLRYTCIVRLENGELIQVGYECLEKVLGYKPEPKSTYSNSDSFELFKSFGFFNTNEFETRKVLRLLLVYLNYCGKETNLKNVMFSTIKQNKKFIEYYKKQDVNFVECDKIIDFYKTYEPSNEFTSNIKSLLTKDTFSSKYFNTFKYCVKVYLDTINFKPKYNSVETNYTTTKVKEITFIRVNHYSGYGWESTSNIYRIIDNKGNVFEFGTSKDNLPQVNDTIEFKYKYKEQYKDLAFNINYGFINKIRNIKIIKEL